MEHAVAVVGPTEEAKALVREAGKLIAGVDAELTLLHVTTEEEYTERREELEQVSNYEASYSISQAMEGARNYAADIGREVLDGVDVEWRANGALGDRGDTIVTEANRHDADHVFMSGRKRSPTGKALFGDATQQVILEFEGPVTVYTV